MLTEFDVTAAPDSALGEIPVQSQSSSLRGKEHKQDISIASRPSSLRRQLSSIPALDDNLTPTYASRHLVQDVPKYHMPQKCMPPRIAAQLIQDEMTLDGTPGLNLATFVDTYMDPEVEPLLLSQLKKNAIDADEYPRTQELEDRCVRMLADLYHAPLGERCCGTGCVGSSEGCLLGGLAMKLRWRARRQAAGLPSDKPNLVISTSAQVIWKKFFVICDVEPKWIPLAEGRYTMSVQDAISQVDENTIGVVMLFASTLTGEYEAVEEMSRALDRLNAEKGWDVGIHVDAASGGFVAPFVQKDIQWDFRLPLVRSINVSSHKYGLVYPGIGFVLWRTRELLPNDMVFGINYLGGEERTCGVNFSRSAVGIVGQYYNFLRLGRDGYKAIMVSLMEVCAYLNAKLCGAEDEEPHFERINKNPGVPLLALSLTREEERGYSVFDITKRLREHNWIVPAYTLAENAEHIKIMRIVVREGLSLEMAEKLVDDIMSVIKGLDSNARAAARHAQPPC